MRWLLMKGDRSIRPIMFPFTKNENITVIKRCSIKSRYSHLKLIAFFSIWVTIGYGIFLIKVKLDFFFCLKHLGQHFHFWWNVKYGVWYKCLQETLFTSLQTIILTLYIPRQSMQKRKKWYGADRKSIMRRDSENCMTLMALE